MWIWKNVWKKLRHILQKCEKDHDFIIMHWGMSFELNSQLCPGYWARSEPQHATRLSYDFHKKLWHDFVVHDRIRTTIHESVFVKK